MGLDVRLDVVLYFALGLALLYALGWLLLVPARRVAALLANSALGIAALLLVNAMGASSGYAILLNPFTALMIGFLGLPGVALAALLQWLL